MKKIAFYAMAAALLFATEANAGKKAVMKTAHDSTSYALGIQVGMSLKGQLTSLPGESVNMDLFLESLANCLQNADTSTLMIKPSQTSIIINNYMQKAQEEQNRKDQKRNEEYLSKNAKQPGVVTTKSGLQYMILKEGEGSQTPGLTDKVKVKYTGKLIDGKVFDSTDGREPAEFELNRVIKGWTEGLQLMTIGSQYRFFIPAELGYGSRAMSSIPANSILIFDVELMDIGKATAQPQLPAAKFQFNSYEK